MGFHRPHQFPLHSSYFHLLDELMDSDSLVDLGSSVNEWRIKYFPNTCLQFYTVNFVSKNDQSAW